LKLRIRFEFDKQLFGNVNAEDEVPCGPLLYRYGDVWAMSRGDEKHTVEWHDSWPTCFVTAVLKCLSVCRVSVPLWGSFWAHDRLANLVQPSLVICQRVVMYVLLLSWFVERRFIFFVTQGQLSFSILLLTPVTFQIPSIKHANPISHPV